MRSDSDAWKILGIDPEPIYARLAALPRSARAAAARADLIAARKAAKVLMAANHPDKGGDPNRFKEVNDSLISLEAHVEGFARAVEESEARRTERSENRPVFIKIGK